ncbi:hypothetical protein Poli38472_011938 [Pythium oligandrum]|uniref:Neutral zinc metallopeptidase n=1 Tax=Pythium oligandrum TaxID=41045 RepID=A0A8K1CQI9_PYTOL|nr:hypothetical protein Poli38472_011938 [Pythium oligandrum]|eukprot:TMW66822.1 hypothetical protein Poli38472_011938 [Pythium oligandrum]
MRVPRQTWLLLLVALFLVGSATASYTTDEEDNSVTQRYSETPKPTRTKTPKPPKTPRPKKTKKTKTPRPTSVPPPTTEASTTPSVTTAAPVSVVPSSTTSVPATTTAPVPVPVPAPVVTATPSVTATPVAPGANATAGGKCVTGDPTTYISKAYVDWIYKNRMQHVPDFKNFIFDQLMNNNGKLSYCVRWDSKNKLSKATASKFQKMLETQYKQWNKWLVGYGCWPFDSIQVEMVGVAVRDKALLDWSDDSLGPIYSGVVDADGVPMCPEACYKHRNFEKLSDTSTCTGKPFDISLWPTQNMGGGAGGDWGQRVDEANMISQLDADSSVIVAHEIGHGFGLPDFYQESEKPGLDMPKMIMEAGASMSVTDGDGWILRRAWEVVRLRYPSTSG